MMTSMILTTAFSH